MLGWIEVVVVSLTQVIAGLGCEVLWRQTMSGQKAHTMTIDVCND